AFLKNIKRYETEMKDKKLVEWLSQDPYPQVHYDRGLSMLYVFKKSLERLSQEDKGANAIQLLSQLAYLDPKGIPLDFILALDEKDNSLLKRKTRAVLLLLEKYSLVQWDREAKNAYIHAETQLIVRELYPQESLTRLISSLINYAGKVEEAYQHQEKWISFIPHGRSIYKRIDMEEYLRATQSLAQYLADACTIACLFEEAVFWSHECLNASMKIYSYQDHLEVANALEGLGKRLKDLGRYHALLQYYKQALDIRVRLAHGKDHPDVARSLNGVGVCLDKLGIY
ncbi:MAG: tetratricopeptide repeat protein, partial [Bacteroidota bacterium]